MKDYPIINRSDVGASNSVICTSILSRKISVPCLYYPKNPPTNTNIIGCLYMIVFEYSFTCKKISTKTFIGFASLLKKFERSTSCCLVSILPCPRYKWTTIFKQQKNFKYINSEIGFHVFYLIYLPVPVTGFFSLWIQFGPINRNQWFFISTNINHI